MSFAPFLLEFFTEKEAEALKSPRILATHMRPDMLPKDTFKVKRKVILVCRNPKDTAVSMFYHLLNDKTVSNGMVISWNCYIETWMKGLSK